MTEWLWLYAQLSALGESMIFLSYLLLQYGKVSSRSPLYLWGNLIGSSFVFFQLLVDFNLAQACVSIGWLVVSAGAIYQWLNERRISPSLKSDLPITSRQEQ